MPIQLEIINQAASQALRGQNAKVTVDLTTQSAEFAQLQVGQLSDGLNYYVYSIDRFGNTFEIAPYQPNFNVSDNGNGYIAEGNAVFIVSN